MAKCCFKLNEKLFNFGDSGGCEGYVEVAKYAALPATGEADIIYKTLDDEKVYEWNGSDYVELEVQSTPIGATLMKTGQTTSYITGDDGDLEKGRPTNFTTLENNNPFGNTNRFTDELGGQTYTNNIVIDWSTFDGVSVLGYYRRLLFSGSVYDFSWNNAIDLCLAFSIGSYLSGWRMPNENEVHNLCNFSRNYCFDYVPFTNPYGEIRGQNLWTSTTLAISTSNAIYMPNYNYGYFTYAAKTSNFRTIAVRNFIVTGTTLT